MNWPELRKQFLKEIIEGDKRLKKSVSEFSDDFLADLKSKGYKLSPALLAKLDKFSKAQEAPLTEMMKAVVLPAIKIKRGLGRRVRDKMVNDLVKEIFDTKYTDGLKLSDRVWKTNRVVRTGLRDVLKRSVANKAASTNVIMDMQAVIEAEAGQEFALKFSDRVPQWLNELDDQARRLTVDSKGMEVWHRTRAEVKKQIENLAESGTKRGAQQYLKEIQAAVEKGRLDLTDKALNNYLYDKQLYALKRIQRTETSNAYHLAQIRATEDDPEIIGYQWRTSPTHPKPDVCDFYATVDHGLGKGVWPKDKVPRRKAHPQCLCDLLPVISPIKEEGYKDLDDFVDNHPGAAALKPKWVKDMEAAGAPTAALTGQHGWFGTKKPQKRILRIWQMPEKR